jgi:hypothetical protein
MPASFVVGRGLSVIASTPELRLKVEEARA